MCCPPPLSDVAKHGQCAPGNVPGENGYNRCHILSQKRSGAIDIIDGHDVFEGVKQSHY